MKRPGFLLLIILFASACAPLTPVPGLSTAAFAAETASSSSPIPPHVIATATRSSAPTSTPVPAHTPTLPAYLQVETSQLRGMALSVWHPLAGGQAEIFDALVRKFNQENEWGIQVNQTATGGNSLLYQMVETGLKNGALPNVLVAPGELLHEWQNRSGLLIGLDDYIQHPNWGFSSLELGDFPVVFWKQDQIEDIQIGIPLTRDAQVLFYNQSWGRELGFSAPPTTAEEFKKQACAAASAILKDQNRENDGTGGWIVSTDALALLSWLTIFGYEVPSDPNSQLTIFNVQSARDAFDFLRALYEEGCAWVARNPLPYDYFAARQALFYSGALSDIPPQEDAIQRHESPDAWMVIPYPTAGNKPLIYTSGLSYAIFAASPQEQLASWLFIRWMATSTTQVQLIEAGGGWPVNVSAVEKLSNYRQDHPQWANTLTWIPLARPVPQGHHWLTALRILEDAGWQLFQPQPDIKDQIPAILAQLDLTIAEVLKILQETDQIR
jgi:multiple sugar transport system substrate-binding protein